MYDRAARTLTRPAATTTPNVGPGTYSVNTNTGNGKHWLASYKLQLWLAIVANYSSQQDISSLYGGRPDTSKYDAIYCPNCFSEELFFSALDIFC